MGKQMHCMLMQCHVMYQRSQTYREQNQDQVLEVDVLQGGSLWNQGQNHLSMKLCLPEQLQQYGRMAEL
jgi:hypothetical protein